jgi:hypothetical protein
VPPRALLSPQRLTPFSFTTTSISGHYAFHLFYVFTMLYLMVDLKRNADELQHFFNHKLFWKLATNKLTIRAAFIIWTFILYCIVSTTTLFRTWMFGYHSMGQIVLGVVWAIVAHSFLVFFVYPNVFSTSFLNLMPFLIEKQFLTRVNNNRKWTSIANALVYWLGCIPSLRCCLGQALHQ